jgi:hypothetical protein
MTNEDRAGVSVWELATDQQAFRIDQLGMTGLAFAPDGRTLATAGGDGSILLWDLTGVRGRPAKAISTADLNACWEAMSRGADAALPAVWGMASDPERAVPFVRGRLNRKPPGMEQVVAVAADLESVSFRARERATSALRALEPDAATLRRALEGDYSPEARVRLERLLKHADGRNERARSLRVVQMLEYAGTEAARRLMTELAGGKDEDMAREAKAALKRPAPPR